MALGACSRPGGATTGAAPIQLSTQATHAQAAPLDGQTVSGKVYVFVPAEPALQQVSYFLDDPQESGTPLATATGPYDLAVGGAPGWDTTGVSDGTHELTAELTFTDASGSWTDSSSASFTVHNGSGGSGGGGTGGSGGSGGGTGAVWHPAPGTTWQWQLTGTIDTSVNVAMYDIDLFDAPQATIAQLHQQGRKVICYMSAGTYENWRPDASSFPASVLGNGNGWPGEKWLDVRQISVLGPIMEKRMDLAVSKGCDGIEPDNIDGYSNNTGFPITQADAVAYDTFLANQAHQRGLSIGLKNSLELVPQMVGTFDWALDEQCFQYSECNALKPFISAGKAVFEVEYNLATSQFCPQANSLGFSSLKKNLNLDAWRQSCL